MKLTRQHILAFLKTNKLMQVATAGDFPWIATVYYSFDKRLNLYFLSSEKTLHSKQIKQNPKVSVAIADSRQDIKKPKKGLQLYGLCKEISGAGKIKHALSLWKEFLSVDDPELSYENLRKGLTGKIYKITPKRIKLFDQELFKDVDDGEEPVLEL
ncbi:MAG: pyridoxamine 5'-phosphate oxidase family protein [Patescibacteria group bacterium]